MTDITKYWYRHLLRQHYQRMKRLIRFVETVRPLQPHQEAFDEAVKDLETVFNTIFIDELNAGIEVRQKAQKDDELPF